LRLEIETCLCDDSTVEADTRFRSQWLMQTTNLKQKHYYSRVMEIRHRSRARKGPTTSYVESGLNPDCPHQEELLHHTGREEESSWLPYPRNERDQTDEKRALGKTFCLWRINTEKRAPA
jgi:hypothetical protein